MFGFGVCSVARRRSSEQVSHGAGSAGARRAARLRRAAPAHLAPGGYVRSLIILQSSYKYNTLIILTEL